MDEPQRFGHDELCRRLVRVEANCFAMRAVLNALIASHPDPAAMRTQWRFQRSAAEVGLLGAFHERGETDPVWELAQLRQTLQEWSEAIDPNVPSP